MALTVDAAVLVAAVEAVVLQDVQQTGHLAEDEHARVAGLELGQQLVQQHQLPCNRRDNPLMANTTFTIISRHEKPMT